MLLDIKFDAKPKVVAHAICCRCRSHCEMAPIGTGGVPVGPGGALEKTDVILCLDCKELMVEWPKKFWYEGWPSH